MEDLIGNWGLRSASRQNASSASESSAFKHPISRSTSKRRILNRSSSSSDFKENERSLTPNWAITTTDESSHNDRRKTKIPAPTIALSCITTNTFDGAYEDDRPKTPATLPRAFARLRRTPFHRRPSLGTLSSATPSLRRTHSTTCPDRFVAVRRPELDSTLSFRSGKDPGTLSKDEKLLRHKDATLDAFNPRRRVTSPVPRTNLANPGRIFSVNRSGAGGASALTFRQEPTDASGHRQVSVGTVWTVGGLAPVSTGVSDGRGGYLGSGTNAPLYTSSFVSEKPRAREEAEQHESRLAQALDIDRAGRILEFRDAPCPRPIPLSRSQSQIVKPEQKTIWEGTEWILGCPGRILDAPNLRDDFYCSVLAYSSTRHTLAVGLGSLLYAWSEKEGVYLLHGGIPGSFWLTTLGFSSSQGKKSILAFGRSDGTLTLMSLLDPIIPRFEVRQPCPIACLTWRPIVTMRPSQCPSSDGVLAKTEDLLVGDEVGNVYYYAVEWPEPWEVSRSNWSGSMTLLIRISCHTQQICGLSFSGDGSMFATGGNDNLCCLFQTRTALQTQPPEQDTEIITDEHGTTRLQQVGGRSGVAEVKPGGERHRWSHGAAVKAIAFCPWREGLVATGGGSNDKCIHFFHTTSGACLATISVAAQVTSLIWSTTRREIVATFGYAQPDHPFRIAVFSWPDCKQVAAIPWDGEHRALYAIPYPGGPNESSTSREGGRGMSRTAAEGCIVVASSDESVKFHEVWTSTRKATTGGEGLLGGSDILEGLEGIDKEGEVIR